MPLPAHVQQLVHVSPKLSKACYSRLFAISMLAPSRQLCKDVAPGVSAGGASSKVFLAGSCRRRCLCQHNLVPVLRGSSQLPSCALGAVPSIMTLVVELFGCTLAWSALAQKSILFGTMRVSFDVCWALRYKAALNSLARGARNHRHDPGRATYRVRKML